MEILIAQNSFFDSTRREKTKLGGELNTLIVKESH